jgi:3D (Asp-Asp-Asp) domain-containing protein
VIAEGMVAAFTIVSYSTGCDTKPGSLTKAGTTPVAHFTVAADPAVLPIGSIVHVEGLGLRMVHDVGSGIRGYTLDLWSDSCREAREWGRRTRKVRVIHRPGR